MKDLSVVTDLDAPGTAWILKYQLVLAANCHLGYQINSTECFGHSPALWDTHLTSQCDSPSCGTRKSSTGPFLSSHWTSHFQGLLCLHACVGKKTQWKHNFLKSEKREFIQSREEHLIGHCVDKPLAEFVVWSLLGPVYRLDVDPLPLIQSNSSTYQLLTHVHIPGFSKSQFPTVRTNLQSSDQTQAFMNWPS